MVSKRHFLFNIAIMVLPWLSLLLLGKRNFKRFWIAGFVIVLLELINHKVGQMRKWWIFFDKPKSFLTNELPFSIGPYMPLSLWLLTLSYGKFFKFIFLNIVADGIFAYFIINVLKKMKIIGLHRLTNTQFFWYLHYKAYILYGTQYLLENRKKVKKVLGIG